MPVTKKRLVTSRRASLAGMTGPVLFGGGLVTLTGLQYDFLVGIGWEPLRNPSGAWPSGLSLGPYGWVQDLDFAVSGLLLAVFALGLYRGMAGASRVGPALLFVAGIAMALLGFKIDPTYGGTPRTLHGAIHDAAFGLLGLSLILALVLLSRQFDRHPHWRGHARYTLATGVLVAPAFALKGLLFYLFLANTLAWIEITAIRLRRIAVMNEKP